jgi:hypothetical protein
VDWFENPLKILALKLGSARVSDRSIDARFFQGREKNLTVGAFETRAFSVFFVGVFVLHSSPLGDGGCTLFFSAVLYMDFCTLSLVV